MSKLTLGEDSSESTGQSGDGDSVTSEAEATNVSSATTDAVARSTDAWNSASPANDHCQSVSKSNEENLKSKLQGGIRNFTPFLMYNRGHSLRPAAPVSREMTFDTVSFGQDEYPHIDMSAYEDYLKPIYKDGDVLLEIECGENKAMLYLSKLCQGSKGPCILFDDMWLTPNEFQYISGRETAKDWKRSIRHHGKSMKLLLSKGILAVHPPICDCEGCRISSPVNRCRLAEKRTAPPPSEKHLSKRKKTLVIPSWSNLTQSLRIAENERKRKHSASFDSSSNEGDSSERVERLKSPDSEAKRESRLTIIIDQLLHNKKKGLQVESDPSKSTVAEHENPVIKEDLDSRDESSSGKTNNCFNSTTESDDSSNDMSSSLTSPMSKPATEDVKLEKPVSDDNCEGTVSVTSELDLSLPVKSEENNKPFSLNNSNNSNGDIQTNNQLECQEQNCSKFENSKVKRERQSPVPSLEDNEVSESTASLLPPEAYLQTGSRHLNNRFHYFPYAHSHFLSLGLAFDKASPAANYTKFSLKQLDMMSRNYSEYIRSLAAKYRANGDNTMKLNEVGQFLPNYEEYYRNHAFGIPFHIAGHDLRPNWTLENQFPQFYTDHQRLHSNMRMVELQSSPALTHLLKNSYTEGTTTTTPSTKTDSQTTSRTPKRRCSDENETNVLDLSTDKKSRNIKTVPSKCCETITSNESLQPHQNLRDLLGHNVNQKIKENIQSTLNKDISTVTESKTLPPLVSKENTTIAEAKSLSITNRHISALVEPKPVKRLKSIPVNSIRSSSSQKLRASQACPDNPEVAKLSHWTVREVYSFVKSIPACTEYAEMFRDHSIDGTALPLLTEDHLMNNMGMKLGPALKLRAMIANKFGNCNKCLHCLHCHGTHGSPDKRCASN